MLDPTELARTAAEFGVADDQVHRDHLISHILHALGEMDVPVTFFGGTALARTWASNPLDGRLSEDIDLLTPDRGTVASMITDALPRALRREFPRTTWSPPLTDVRAVDPATLVTSEGLRVRVQLLDSSEHREFAAWPTARHPIEMRYSDVEPTELLVPTLTSFAGMKTVAWMDRGAARDLYDLAVLARLDALTAEAADLVHTITGWSVRPYAFRTLPSFDWHAQLGHQTNQLPPAESCLSAVRAAYAKSLEWEPASRD
ncbi:nucleotidyl transferase AbiEii/AbiGii toxin family protein [Actinokineospora sp. HUAS TT18]|uniref:nucleotidyl transferase AbiEii/AbiGii toxin family protein n=1 Tax=Actinokineospora sp. HUAS TT18 TaxID=3447451 RepID=UPI003F52222F